MIEKKDKNEKTIAWGVHEINLVFCVVVRSPLEDIQKTGFNGLESKK